MWKRTANNWPAGVIFSAVAVVLASPAISLAGPGCMSDKGPMARGYYPPAPMAPHTMYRHGVPYADYRAPMPYGHGMMPRYQRQMPAQWNNPQTPVRPAGPAPVENAPGAEHMWVAGSDSESGTESITVRIDGMRFEPANITVRPGTTVTWVHGSSMPHTVTGDASGPQSNTLYNGQTFSHTFDEAGRFDYVCGFHPSMKGSVTVEAGGADA